MHVQTVHVYGTEETMEKTTDVFDMKIQTGMSGSTLKLLAMGSMLIDHIGATIVERQMLRNPSNFAPDGTLELNAIVILYFVMRIIGRLAFPIFIFLLVEGYSHTRNPRRYIVRLLLFAGISEIPFDLAFRISSRKARQGVWIDTSAQNVFFTLAIGLAAIHMIKQVQERYGKKGKSIAIQMVVIVLTALLAELLHTDYAAAGVLAIIVAYYTKELSVRQRTIFFCIPLVIASPLEVAAVVDSCFFRRYNGTRGLSLKWVFYLFYPLHLLVLAGVCIMMGW
ncbi:MAG: TraX family protein [Wujia sp.]